MPAILAKYLVVQRERGPERIVEDCASGKFGEPKKLTRATSALEESFEPAAETVRLETVGIKNFRAYRKQQSFAVGADVTLLYGPNGFGKTSFFDAIDFAITGGVGRMKSLNEPHFKKTAKHLDSSSEESVVSLSLRSKDVVRTIRRNVSDAKRAVLDGRPADRKAILDALTGGDIPATDRVENFVSLFRATHLFSQEQQELTRDFQDDCQLSAPIVSRMLAFEDYANAVSKAAKVRGMLQSIIGDANARIKELADEIADDKKELERLSQTTKTLTSMEALDAEIEAVREKLTPLGISVPPLKPDAGVVRGWRVSLEARHAESQSRIGRLSALSKDVGGIGRLRVELATLQQDIAQKEGTLQTVEQKRAAAEQDLQRTEQHIVDLNAKNAETLARANALEWIRATKPRYVQLVERHRTLRDEVKPAAEAVAQYRAAEESLNNDLRTKENLAAQASNNLKAKHEQLATLQTLAEAIERWQTARAGLDKVAESERAGAASLESLRAEERKLSPQLEALVFDEARIARQISEVDKNQSELRNLLSALQGHIQTGTCPLCGEDHGSKAELLRRMQEHVANDAASFARTELQGVRERLKQTNEQLAGNRQKQQAGAAALSDLKKERGKLEAEIGSFVSSAASLRVNLEPRAPTPAEQLQERQKALMAEITDGTRNLQELDKAVQAARTNLATAKGLTASKTGEIAARNATLTELEAQTSVLQDDQRSSYVSLDISVEELANSERVTSEIMSGFKGQLAAAQAQVVRKKPEVNALQHESTAIRNQISALRTQVANLQKTVMQITAKLEEFKLPADTDEATVLGLLAEESRTQTQLTALRDSVSNLELAIDSATTAAALARLSQNLRNKETAVATGTRQREQHQPWLKYFDDLSRLISGQQNEAIADFTREYGPRTAVIQRRLRSVYGFDEIEMQSRESTISVRVKRRGEELRPTDYFSQSQQQTLLLSLFLTACSSQSWSAFSPVFLDDPVTHFDDLNTYAFLDLIVGLLESDFGKRQFIISTCDEKLLQLARQKFRHLGERAKFHRFTAIGPDGPVVDEIAAT